MVAASTQPEKMKLPLTYADLARFPDDGNRYEIIDGSLFVTPSPFYDHQLCVTALIRIVSAAVPEDLAVLPAPMDVRFANDTVLQPDLLVVSRRALAPGPLPGSLHLAVEIASPSTARYDALLKRDTYARFAVTEYWICDPKTPSLRVLHLAEGGASYEEYAYVEGDDAYADDRYGVRLVPAEIVNG